MRAATIEGACGVAEIAVKGESVAVGMRATTIKGACGVATVICTPWTNRHFPSTASDEGGGYES